MVVTELTELLRDALVDRGFLGLAEAECVCLNGLRGQQLQYEVRRPNPCGHKRFLAAMEEMGYAPDSYDTLPLG
jgi:hypothetical protein